MSDDKAEREEIKRLAAGPRWGFMVGAVFIPIPKIPLLQAGYNTPPFMVKLPGGYDRHIIVDPDDKGAE